MILAQNHPHTRAHTHTQNIYYGYFNSEKWVGKKWYAVDIIEV